MIKPVFYFFGVPHILLLLNLLYFFPEYNDVVSSANTIHCSRFDAFGKAFICNVNKIGLSAEPCGPFMSNTSYSIFLRFPK